MDFHQTWSVHWYGGDLICDCWWENFLTFLTESSARDTTLFSFLIENFSKSHEFSPKLVCALILWRSALGLLMGKFRLFLTELSAHNTSPYFTLRTITWVNLNVFLSNLVPVCAFILWRSALGLLIGKFHQFHWVICLWHDNGGVLSFRIFLKV